LMIGTVGVAMCFFLNGVTFVAVIAGLLMMRLPEFERPAHNLLIEAGLDQPIDGLVLLDGKSAQQVEAVNHGALGRFRLMYFVAGGDRSEHLLFRKDVLFDSLDGIVTDVHLDQASRSKSLVEADRLLGGDSDVSGDGNRLLPRQRSESTHA